jgi:3'-phosphoadenosine 5'-phosphosulfate sulfotransferase (PAPS reductase)/FAD synthetase
MDFWNNKQKTPEQKAHIIDRAQTLQAGINRPFADKMMHARKVIRLSMEAHPELKWAISYSAGRDSTTLSHLMVEDMGIRHIPHVMSNTRMEYPETLQMYKKWKAWLGERGVECHQVFPDERPKSLWARIGVPLWSKMLAYKYRQFVSSKSGRMPSHVPEDLHEQFRRAKEKGLKITEECCKHLKKIPMKKWDETVGVHAHFTGVRCAESRARRLAWITCGALYRSSKLDLWISNPLAFWTDQDVATYLKINSIEVIRPDTLSGGSGCVTCLFGSRSRALAGEKNSMQDLKTRNPKMWKEALDAWGYRPVLDELGIPYE